MNRTNWQLVECSRVHRRWASARRVGLVRSLGAVAAGWGAVVDRGQVRLGVCSTSERRDDMVNGIGSGLVADVADASVALQNPGAEALPVGWQRGAAVSGHGVIVP